jgi:hypothetical protein
MSEQNLLPDDEARPAKSGTQTGKDAPAWLWPLFAFIAGVAVTVAMLSPSIATPDYDRGHKAGYAIGKKENAEVSYDVNARVREAMFSGIQMGYAACQRGEPMPVDLAK